MRAAQAPDKTYSRLGAFIDGFEFDWRRYRVPKSTFEATDISHWLALEVAARALADAGFDDLEGRPELRRRTSCIVGNTLTGEFTRSNSLRLRWPFVRRALAGTPAFQRLPAAEAAQLLAELEDAYTRNFPATSEDTLAGGLSNTIAGRICGYFDFGGGGCALVVVVGTWR